MVHQLVLVVFVLVVFVSFVVFNKKHLHGTSLIPLARLVLRSQPFQTHQTSKTL